MVDMSKYALSLLILLAASTTGCAGGRFLGLEWPRFGYPPGTVEAQRSEAALHDPYPDPDAGPPVVGGRPREFQKPQAEPARPRWLPGTGWQW
jgi:hypothetical protein